jgi:hypothetical protein
MTWEDVMPPTAVGIGAFVLAYIVPAFLFGVHLFYGPYLHFLTVAIALSITWPVAWLLFAAVEMWTKHVIIRKHVQPPRSREQQHRITAALLLDLLIVILLLVGLWVAYAQTGCTTQPCSGGFQDDSTMMDWLTISISATPWVILINWHAAKAAATPALRMARREDR